jgi:hypothetical protein
MRDKPISDLRRRESRGTDVMGNFRSPPDQSEPQYLEISLAASLSTSRQSDDWPVKVGIITRLGVSHLPGDRDHHLSARLLNGGLREYAQQLEAHEIARATKLYDRRNDLVTLDQVGQIPGA